MRTELGVPEKPPQARIRARVERLVEASWHARRKSEIVVNDEIRRDPVRILAARAPMQWSPEYSCSAPTTLSGWGDFTTTDFEDVVAARRGASPTSLATTPPRSGLD